MANYRLTNTLSHITANNITLYLVPNSGQELPPSAGVGITTDGTIISYDATTGILVVSGETTYVSATCSIYPTAVPNIPTATVNGPFLVIQDDSAMINKADTFTANYYYGNTLTKTETVPSSKL